MVLQDYLRAPGFDDDKTLCYFDARSLQKELGKNFQSKIYSGAGHGFFCNERPSHHEEASKDAWQRTLDFLDANLKKATATAG